MAAPIEESNVAEDFKKPILPPPLPLSLARGKAAEREAPKRPHGPEVGPCPLVLPEYEEPPWGGCPSEEESSGYSLETVKGGAVLDRVSFAGRSRLLVGRAPGCDLSLAHPCVSRHHAVLQRRPPRSSAEGEEEPLASETPEPGLYVYDLNSAHGTFLNKARVPPRTYCRVRVGHVLRFGGSSRLFILQGPEEDQEPESELTVTQLKELRKQQQAKLEKTMLGDDSDEEQKEIEIKKSVNSRNDLSCSWGMGEDAEEEEGEENPIAIEFQEDQEAFYLKDPKKALQGFFDREGEELEYEFDSHGTGTWLCRVKLPIDDASGKQLVAEAIHSGKKKEAMIQCSLEACRILDARGVLRQEAVSRKRKAKNWEEEDFYDSDDDIFLDRTGVIEQKRLNRMKKAGKIDEKPETYDSLVAKLHAAERELSEIAEKLKSSRTTQSHSATQDSLDEFMTEIKSGCSVDSVTRKKLHLRTFELRKEQQRLKGLIKIVTPASMPELKSQLQNQDLESQNKPKKLTLPLFGAMKGGSKFRLKTGTVGKLPMKRPDIPVNLLKMKDEEPEEEEEEEEEEEDDVNNSVNQSSQNTKMEMVKEGDLSSSYSARRQRLNCQSESSSKHTSPLAHNSPVNELQIKLEASEMPAEKPKNQKVSSKPKIQHSSSSNYPEDDPDYCVWVPPEGQSGDGRTHLNAKYGY
ncbi:kanadaptin [Pseudonaja textilis]|nr:kanadaptin [Pseudonaja textilis]XP_026551388.1 kanadaptin [Pseudonaja textilis]XP_026551390.1 kanadaptin [Pseudonaja textilis]